MKYLIISILFGTFFSSFSYAKPYYISLKAAEFPAFDEGGIPKVKMTRVTTFNLFDTQDCMLNRSESTFTNKSLLASAHSNENSTDIITVDLIQELYKVTYVDDDTWTEAEDISTLSAKSVEVKKYEVQAGYFKNYENAVRLINKLKSNFDQTVKMKKETNNNKTRYRVMIGEFNSKQNAASFLKSLRNLGFKGIVKGGTRS